MPVDVSGKGSSPMTAPTTRADHAELARLRQHIVNLKLRPGHHVQFGTPSVSQISNYWNRDLAADLENLLSEIAALRGERDRLKLAICGGEDAPGAINAVTVKDCEGFIREGHFARGDAIDRATQAERQRDELRRALERQCDNMAFALNRVDLHAWAVKFEQEVAEDRALLANQGADQ